MFFEILQTGAVKHKGSLGYITDENSFIYLPWGTVDFSVMLGKAYASLDVCLNTNEVLQVSGCNPIHAWIRKKLIAPTCPQGILKVSHIKHPIPGTGEDYSTDWETYFDQENGWICIGNCKTSPKNELIMFADNSIAVLHNKKLISLWLKPQFI